VWQVCVRRTLHSGQMPRKGGSPLAPAACDQGGVPLPARPRAGLPGSGPSGGCRRSRAPTISGRARRVQGLPNTWNCQAHRAYRSRRHDPTAYCSGCCSELPTLTSSPTPGPCGRFSGAGCACPSRVLSGYWQRPSPRREASDPGDICAGSAHWGCRVEYTSAYGHIAASSRARLEVRS
jgi:hypothetical protein